MRIALISPILESVPPRFYGGTERVVSSLCKGLSQANIDVVLFASGDSTLEKGTLIPVIDEALRLRKKPVQDPWAFYSKLLSLVAKEAEHVDLIHNHHDYWMLPLTEMRETPLLTTLHGRIDIPEAMSAYLGFPRAQFVSISNAQRCFLQQLRWAATIHHGIDVNDYTFTKKPGSYLAFLGRISPEKRPDWAIQIAKMAGVPLKIAAKIEGRQSQAYFDANIKPHVDGKFIEFLGEISEAEKSDFLGNALALAFPIDWPEPFGLVMIESLACGTPVLARPMGSVPEILRNGVTGYVSSDLRRLARSVRDIPMMDRRRCRQWVEERFSLQRMTEEYIHVYRTLTTQGSRPNRHRWNFLYPVQRSADWNP